MLSIVMPLIVIFYLEHVQEFSKPIPILDFMARLKENAL